MKSLFISILAGLSVMSAAAHAHQYWLEPNEFFFFGQTQAMDGKVSQRLSVDFSGGDTYFNADVNRASESKEYTFSITSPDGEAIEPSRSFIGTTRFIAEAELAKKGTYVLSMSRVGMPMYYCKLADGTWVPKAKDTSSALQRDGAHCGGYFQHTKSYSSLAQATDSWKNPLGHPLEIIPLAHPNLLFTGDTFTVKLLAAGKPLADTKIVGFYQEYRASKHGDSPISAVTDQEGIASFTFDRASRWLLTTKQETANADTAKAETTTHQASLMLEVNEPWVKEWLSTNKKQ